MPSDAFAFAFAWELSLRVETQHLACFFIASVRKRWFHKSIPYVRGDLLGLDAFLYKKATRLWEKRFCQIDPDDVTICKQLSAPALNEVALNERGNQPIHLAASFGTIPILSDTREIDLHPSSCTSLLPHFPDLGLSDRHWVAGRDLEIDTSCDESSVKYFQSNQTEPHTPPSLPRYHEDANAYSRLRRSSTSSTWSLLPSSVLSEIFFSLSTLAAN